MMIMEKEDLGLSLSLSCSSPYSSSVMHGFPQLSFMSSSSSSSYTSSSSSSYPSLQPPFPFSCHQKPPQWSDLLIHHSEKRTMLDACTGAEETRPMLRGIDVNRAPSAATTAVPERESEEDVGASSPNSTVSTLSGAKRPAVECDAHYHHLGSAGVDEHDVERASSRGISDEEDGDGSRKKLRLSKDQSAILEENFKEHNTLNPKQKLALAKQLNLRPRQVEVWFQNRRARTKLKQTEVDCEFLKRCCENLTEENRRLQKEVQELRALKLSPQFYMHASPPTTLTMCPSCERVSNSTAGAGAGAVSTSSTSTAPPALDHHHPFLHHHHHHHQHRPVAAPWAPIPLRPPFLDAPPPRS